MLKIRLDYDLPEYDSNKHDPDKTFAFLTYRGVHYAKWVNLKPFGITNWKVKEPLKVIPATYSSRGYFYG